MSNRREVKIIIFLYTRLADYFYQSIKYWLDANESYKAIIVRYEPDKNAPFIFDVSERLVLKNKNSFKNFSELQLFVEKCSPSAIYTAGWSDKDYIKIANYFFKKIPTIVGLDNPWKGNIRQQIGTIVYSNKLKQSYSHIWVAGKPQYEFAKRIGFRNDQILSDLYCANTPIFEPVYKERLDSSRSNYPKKILYIGRYVDYKQPLLLVQLFSELAEEGVTNGWSLELIGAGPLEKELKRYESSLIKVNGFIEPKGLPQKFKESGVFCLPSKNEHWGVVVHEAVASGLPLLLSNTTHSGSTFLIHKYNGFRFQEDSINDFKYKLKQLFTLEEKELFLQSNRSFELSKKVTQSGWAANLMSVI